MASSFVLKYSTKKGVQKPQQLEEGPIEVLTASVNGEAFQPLGVKATLTLNSEEAVEINTAV